MSKMKSCVIGDAGAAATIRNFRQPAGWRTGHFSGAGMDRAAATLRRLDEKPRFRKALRALRRAASAALVFGIGAFAVLSATPAASASPIACGTIHVVAPGETLFKLARRAYGDGRQYDKIFAANRDVVRRSGSIEIGDQLLIPCLDGSGIVTRAEAATAALIRVEAEPGEIPDAVRPAAAAGPTAPLLPRDLADSPDALPFRAKTNSASILLLTGSGRSPYSGVGLPDGGLATRLLRQALAAAEPDRPVRFTFVDDWSAHMEYLLPEGAFDISFPWTRTGCRGMQLQAPAAEHRCSDFAYSAPIMQVETTLIARSSDVTDAAVDRGILADKTICRSADHPRSESDIMVWAKGRITVVTAERAADCLVMLLSGQVDLAALTEPGAHREIDRLGIGDSVTELSKFRESVTLHAVVYRQNPGAEALLKMIERGLAGLMASGQWFEILASYPQS